MKRLIPLIAAALLLPLAALASDELSDDQIRDILIKQSIAAYPGNCPCPYNTDRAGRRCGKRSAWHKVGGYEPLCYKTDVTDEMVNEFRREN
ncbi:MAG: hypothetical protein MJA83_20615 [Gammaproteobacteria bacterium]|nr:hypothetical protein [Gammaproteobacteria bacterium]